MFLFCIAVKTTSPSINAANISSILPNASLVDTLTDTKITSGTSTNTSTSTDASVQQKPTSSPMAPSEVSPNTAICDRPKVKSVSKKDCKNNRRLATAALAFQSNSTVSIGHLKNFCFYSRINFDILLSFYQSLNPTLSVPTTSQTTTLTTLQAQNLQSPQQQQQPLVIKHFGSFKIDFRLIFPHLLFCL